MEARSPGQAIMIGTPTPEQAEAATFINTRQCALTTRAGKGVHVSGEDGTSVSAEAFYANWDGHEIKHLKIVHDELRTKHSSIVFLAGDSSLDNKAWFEDEADALNGYEEFLRPPVMRMDISYWMNFEAVQRGVEHMACLNTSIEATTLASRQFGLLPADKFIRDHISAQDYLVVSVGGNDVALKPSPCTIINMLMLVRCASASCLRRCSCSCLPFAGYCGGRVTESGCPGCSRSLLGCACPPGLAYFADLFGNSIRDYVLRLIGSARPRKVLVCCIYFLDQQGSGWADEALAALDYDRNPRRLQEAIRAIFRLATRRIRHAGINVVAIPLFEALDGRDTGDYVSRVEPSPVGGKKIADVLMNAILE